MAHDSRNCIIKAASLVRGERLGELYALCENQKTVSTAKLERMIDKLAEGMTLDGIFLREIGKKLSKVERNKELGKKS